LATSIIFPAFVNEYTGTEGQAISVYENNFNRWLAIASEILKLDLTGFDFKENNFLNDELKSQYISYLFSCSVADILKGRKVKPSFVSAYSMGIYAALYYCGSITFNDGLLLVKSAWEKICKATESGKYSMGMIIGLIESDILNLLRGTDDVEICNQNNPHTFIISGSYDALEQVLASAKAEGALRTNMLPVSNPYHSKFVKSAVTEFTEVVKELSFIDPAYKYVSAINQKIIDSAEGLIKEVIENLYCRMNWLDTMNLLLTLGTDIFFECGAGDGLTRNSRFIEGNLKSFPVTKLDKFLEAALK
jgi:malonyl CoA-acyl carrier protein transacylase